MFTVSVPHRLPEEEAKKRIEDLITGMREKYGDKISNFQGKWDGYSYTFSLSAMGFSASGKVVIEPDQIVLSANLPLVAQVFQDKIEKVIRERAESFFA